MAKLCEKREQHSSSCCKSVPHLRLCLLSLSIASVLVSVHTGVVIMTLSLGVFLHGVHRDVPSAKYNYQHFSLVRRKGLGLQECPGGKEQQHASPPFTRRAFHVAPYHRDDQVRRYCAKWGSKAEDNQMAPRSSL